MKSSYYAYYDNAIGAYLPPFPVNLPKEDVIESVRRTILKDPQKLFQLKECSLYLVGDFDDELGVFEAKAHPDFVCNLAQFFPKEAPAQEVKQDGSED